jgi:hypothetical protein
MILVTDEPMEGVAFDVQDHARQTCTTWTGTHGEMTSSDMLSIKVALRWTSSEPPKFEHHLFKIQSSEVQPVVKTTFLLYISIKNCNKRCLHDELVKGLSHLKS